MPIVDIVETMALVGAICWGGLFLLPWRPWSTREQLSSLPELRPQGDRDLSDLTVLIPARNEADVIEQTMKSLNDQGSGLSIILVDDQSSDQTAEKAIASSRQNLKVIKGQPLPEGWAGKLWALEQGRAHVKTPLILLLDADISIDRDLILTLTKKMKAENLDFVSLMAELRMKNFWEKLLVPAFIYFFKLLYPFSWGNSPKSKLGVAAGGCILVKTTALEIIGGFESLKSALIDDCSLAQRIKSKGFHTFMGLTHSVKSHREYRKLSELWDMVARSAFTQLFYSNSLLLCASLLMLSMFAALPLAVFISSNLQVKLACAAGILAMVFTYLPTLNFYSMSSAWALLMPFIGILYLLMTWTSAVRYWMGKKSIWKGRIYSTQAK